MAAEFGISIGTKISEYLVEPILISPFRPIFCFRSIVDDFQDQNNKLTAIQERVGNDVQRDRDNAQVIYDNVEEWLKKVNTAMQEVRCVESELVQNKSCFHHSWCPNWTCHYCFSRQVSKMAATMKTLCEEGNSFSSVSHPPALHQDIVGSSSSAPFMHSLSSRSAFDQIMEALESDDINLIGLYGVAGAGKTTMAQLVGEEAKKLCYRVIMVPVAQYPLVRGQQGVIADFLGLQLGQLESEQGRAAKLQLRLRNCEKILIIFDDVQKEFDLGAIIGIPSSNNGCRILLTAHAEIHVHTQKDIELGALSTDEAWTLLKSIAGVGDEVRTHDVAKDALEECYGLPKAIVAMGTVLNGKGVHEWEETLQQHSAAKFKFTDSLEEGIEKLSVRQDRVNIKINMAKEKGEKIYADVNKWLKDVERVVNDVEQFNNELNQNRWCFDELGVATRVEGLATRVKDLHEQGNFDPVSHPTPLEPGMRLLSSEDFLLSEAAKSAFHQIVEAFKTDGVNMIGLYGMGGIGKTTLASQVHNEVIRQNALAVMVTLSQKPDVGNMQDKIADFLNLKFEKTTLDGRAIELKSRLKNEKILIILDDVWKRFDLRSIGIMLDDCKDCKILMTTRRRDVCSSMNCQSEIQLCLFSEDESQSFFKKKAGLSNELELDDVGKQLVAECKCLPIALETVGAALKRKGKDEWVEALQKVRVASLVDIIGVDNDEKNVYRCLQVSYDYLNDQPQGLEAQFILLLCSLFPEDYEVEVEDLTRYAFGMNLFEDVKSVEDARRKVRVAIGFLRDSCLLSDSGGEEYVKLHDVVRDVLLWVGGKEPHGRNTFTVSDGIHLKDLVRKNSFQNCKALSVTSDVIPKFSKYSELEFPNLDIFLIFDQERVVLGEGFFNHMKLLKVLDVRFLKWWGRCEFAMPQSLQCLEHLRTLMLRNFECSNSSILRDLGGLRILSLRNCGIDCGVEVVSGLKKLRLLDLGGFFGAESVMLTSDVMETLVKLEELYGYRLEKCKDEEGTNSRLSELKLPSNLVALSMKVEDVRCLPTDFCFPNLQCYDIHIVVPNLQGFIHLSVNSGNPSSTREVRRLELNGNFKDVTLNTCKKLFPTVQVFCLSDCDDLYSLPSFNLQVLERLEVRECQKMEWVLKVGIVSNNNESTMQILSLKILHLNRLRELRHIWEGPTRLLNLCNLTQVEIIDCPKLIFIFSSPSLATSLQQLEILKISGCHNLEDIFSRRGGNDDDDFTCCFTNLRKLELSVCHKVKAIFPLALHFHPQSHPCRLPKLERIVLDRNDQLEHIFGHQTQVEEGVECPSLQVLEVTRCPNISTTHFVATLLQLPSSKSSRDIYSMSNSQIVEEPLQRRHADLPQSTIMCFSFLNTVKLEDCNKLKQVFTTSTVTSLHLLEVLVVRRCNELEQIISKVGDGKEEPTVGVFFENLKTLCVSHCGKLKTIFPISMTLTKLEGLELNNIAELEYVFGRSDWDSTRQCPSLKDLCLKDCPKLCTKFVACIQNPSTTEAVQKNKLAYIQGGDGNEDDDLVTSPFKNLFPWSSEDVKCIQHGPTQNICFAGLYQIKVIGCHKLKHLFTTKVAIKFPKLERLIVQRCNELEVILVEDGKKERENDATTDLSAKAGFENLEVLHVSHCRKLKTVFSTFIPLPELGTLLLQSNAILESLFGGSDCDCTSYWTRLNVLSVTGCPKLCTETIAIITSQLQVESSEKRLRIINLSNIRGVEELIQIPRQEGGDVHQKTCLFNQFVQVEELGDLERICSGPTQDISFSYLIAVRVIGCSRLKQLFTTTMVTSLHQLEVLWVEKCDDIEQIIEEEEEEEEGNEENDTQSLQQLDFSNLCMLRLIDLPKLISFCPTSCNLVLRKLTEKGLKVKGCSNSITDFFSKQSYLEKDRCEFYYVYEYETDSEGEDEKDDEEYEKFEDEITSRGCTDAFAWALMGLRRRYPKRDYSWY